MTEESKNDILSFTAEIVAAHVGHNRVAVPELPELIAKVHAALSSIGNPDAAPEVAEKKPAVSIRASVKPDYIVCLEDGKKLTMLKRYLQTNYGMTPQQYRAKWGLAADYPMVAPNYAEKRRSLAKTIGLGRKPAAPAAEAAAPQPEAAPEPAPRKARASRKPAPEADGAATAPEPAAEKAPRKRAAAKSPRKANAVAAS